MPAVLILFILSLVVGQAPPAQERAAGQAAPPPSLPRADGGDAAPQPFLLGMLRRDGIVIPFAAFDGRNWTAPWPENLAFVQLPISLATIPAKWWGKAGLPGEMTAWTDGVRRGTLSLTRPTMLPVMCARRLGLLSSYESSEPAPPRLVQPYPKDGLVITGGQTISAIETVPRTSPDWVASAVSLIEPFEAAELRAIKSFTDWHHPVTRDARRKVPVELETLYRAPMDTPGWTAYHVEAVKRYPPGPDDGGCGLVTYASGWIMRGPGGAQRVKIGAQVTYCERKNSTFMLPLGLITQAGRTYWVYQMSGYEVEGYAVTRPTPKLNDAEVTYTAAACAR